ncbi:efflux RND transporter permease subunit [Sulfitobacter donghicola]|uniref:RND transporter n=1 Tax=Sulfitobacter donghicola DSW-25 = KCTC 12864 = JCM 14565 TaxID=1300350 RepID=A0A073IFD9_9RHOB|nr:efflux RND transporter permease subunit [Sulfitobacter donghicola]KEJ89033.1 RND transporter [Sulfitobacter donghicola DSW-25 = KCTC 12864 = JCM 14565]KIN67400.1 Transporter, AcrB/AcrD/AcrF family protein [Sulfitobacter donghicola DSW-25 = KCTC 12864 = JCM 14565]
MNIARGSIERPIITWLIMLGCLLGGIWAFLSLGRLEDPAFTIKTAVIVTQYPGADAEQVAREVSEPLESEIQKMGEVKEVRSMNQPGLSWITVDMKDQYDGTELPEIWTKLRNRVGNANLPSGTSVPFVNDGFGDVYGIYYAVTAPGFSDAEIYGLSTFLRRELLSVDGVADVSLSGVPNEVVYVEPNLSLTVNQNVPPAAIQAAIANANPVSDAGSFQSTDGRVLLQGPEGNDSVQDIAGLTVGVGGEILNLFDFSTVTRAREQNPNLIIRHDGVEAFTMGVAGLASENIVTVGERTDAKLLELAPQIPLGIELTPIYQQHVIVEEASGSFLVNLALSVGIVVAVLALFMGPRAAVVVGTTLLLTVVGTLLFMGIFSIEMERISLGALIIAMGMLVDNAIVVAEGMQISMARGKTSREAAEDTASKTQIPLLGATVIGIMAFAGIGLSPDATGEFLFSLFAVIAISLGLSWGLALTVTPLLGHYFFKQGQEGGTDAYGGFLFRAYKGLLRFCLKLWWLIIPALLAVTVACFALFGQVKQQFFPDSNTPLFFVHYKLAQGASIHEVSRDLGIMEGWLSEQEDVVAFTSYAGQGASRFMLTYQAEDPNPSYGHIIVRTDTINEIAPLISEMTQFSFENLPQGEFRAKRLSFGPGGGDPIQVRFSGPDPSVLRELSEAAIIRLTEASSHIIAPRTDWREMEQVLRPIYATDRAQQAGISREDIAETMLFATEGVTAGVYREGDRQIPIVMRAEKDANLALTDHVIYTDTGQTFVSFEQVIDGFVFDAQNTLVLRRDRKLTITVGADISPDRTAAEVQAEVQEAMDAMPLPLGYQMEWGGEYESSREAQASLAGQLPLSMIIMVLISILLFNALRQPLIIWLLVPMSVNGVSLALVGTGLPFTFTALLGLLSLSGMLIKNGIVLVEEIDIVRRENPQESLKEAIVTASTSRLRPVILAAATTILGMIPLIWDAFFQSMAVTIMGGLAFASILTLIAAPVFYFAFFRKASLQIAPN